MTKYLEYHLATQNQFFNRSLRRTHKTHYSENNIAIQDASAWPYPRGECVAMPEPLSTSASFEDVLFSRKSNRTWQGLELSSQKLASILGRSLGSKDFEPYNRFVPSSGNIGSVRAHCIALSVHGVKKGIYTYAPSEHALITRSEGDYQTWVRRDVCFQGEFSRASALIALEVNLELLCSKYGERGYRLAFLDAGHVSQALYAAASAYEVGICATAGFFENEVQDALDINGSTSAVVLMLGLGEA